MWMHNLEFNVGTRSIHQLPQTTGDGTHSLLQVDMWDVGDKFPNPVLQLFQCVRFCRYTSSLVQPHMEKSQGVRSGFLARQFVCSSSSQPTSRKILLQPGTYAQCKVWW